MSQERNAGRGRGRNSGGGRFGGRGLAPDKPGAPGSEPFLSGGVRFGAGQTAFFCYTLMQVIFQGTLFKEPRYHNRGTNTASTTVLPDRPYYEESLNSDAKMFSHKHSQKIIN